MRRTWSVAVVRDERPEAEWRRIGDVVSAWAREATVTPVGEVMWHAETGSVEVADALAEAVAALGFEPLRASRSVYEDDDYAVADLIGVTGVDLPLDPPFVRNGAAAFRADGPCPRCGHHDQFDVTQVRPLLIDEDMLDAPAPGGTAPGPRGLEVVNLPDGGMLLSTRLADALKDAGVRGLEAEPVMRAGGRRSKRMVRLRATVAVLVPCPRHTRVEGEPFCPVCGTAHGEVDGFLWMPRSVVGTAEAVSRHPGRAAMLYVSPRVYGVLSEVAGVRRGDPVRVCED